MGIKHVKKAAAFEPTTALAPNACMDELLSCHFPSGNGKHSFGMYTLKKGDSISYVVEEHEVKLITDGSHEIADDEMGQKYMGTSGDLFLLEQGTKVTFRPVSDYAKGFYVTRLPQEPKNKL